MKKQILTGIIASAIVMSFTNPKKINYTVDTKKSTTVWTGKKVTGEHKGLIPLSSGTFAFTDNKISGGTFEFNVAGLTVSDLTDKESNAKLVGHLKSDDFFYTAKFPTSKFIITTIKQKDKENYDITGNLTIKGITNAITFPAVIKSDEKKLSIDIDDTHEP